MSVPRVATAPPTTTTATIAMPDEENERRRRVVSLRPTRGALRPTVQEIGRDDQYNGGRQTTTIKQ